MEQKGGNVARQIWYVHALARDIDVIIIVIIVIVVIIVIAYLGKELAYRGVSTGPKGDT